MKTTKVVISNLKKGFLIAIFSSVTFVMGYLLGSRDTLLQATPLIKSLIEEVMVTNKKPPEIVYTAQKTTTPQPQKVYLKNPVSASIPYSGPELWEAVNKARVNHGVNSLSQKDILCTIAAIRLSQIRTLGKLDGHDGFNEVFEKYKNDTTMPNNVSEFLISGYPTATQAVEAWLDTLGHKKLVTGGEYTWGCVYAQDGFGVAITGF